MSTKHPKFVGLGDLTDINNIPPGDRKEFLGLPPHIQHEILLWIIWIHRLEISKPVLPAAQKISVKSGVNISSVYRKRRDYEAYGWRGLINRAKCPVKQPPTSDKTFLRFLHGLWLANERHYKNTHSQLVAIWQGHAPIPGYKPRPEDSESDRLPDGWTYCNVIYRIDTFAKTLLVGEAEVSDEEVARREQDLESGCVASISHEAFVRQIKRERHR